jgi:hypothetical protein
MGAKVFHADKQTGGRADRRDEANRSFSNFADEPDKTAR